MSRDCWCYGIKCSSLAVELALHSHSATSSFLLPRTQKKKQKSWTRDKTLNRKTLHETGPGNRNPLRPQKTIMFNLRSRTIPLQFYDTLKGKKNTAKGSHRSRSEPSATRWGHFGETLQTLIRQWINKEHWIKRRTCELRLTNSGQRENAMAREMKQKSHVLITRPESSSSSIVKVAGMRLQDTVFWCETLIWSVNRSFSSWLLEQQI